MADKHKSRDAQNAQRIAEWLVNNRTEFEGQGVSEDGLASATGVAEGEVTGAVDYLENREEVVRIPQALSRPPRFVLKPGRGWPEMRDKMLGRRSAG